jgi:hypothetical protein
MILDVTTRNSIYNPTSSQGTWFQHRWGKRDYPVLDLSLELYNTIWSQHDTVALQCVYGDPVDWIHFDAFLDSVTKDRYAHVTTYGTRAIDNKKVNVVFLLDGIEEQCGKVFLGADWSDIKQNIKDTKGERTIQFYLYEHNKYQIPKIQDFCARHEIELRLHYEYCDSTGRQSIINKNKQWLYDVQPHLYNSSIDYKKEKPVELYRTIWAAQFLKVYNKGNHNCSILQHPKRKQLKNTGNNTGYTYVTPTGHAFVHSDEYGMFMNMLCPDWNINFRSYDEYEKTVGTFVRKFSECYLDSMLLEQ